MKKNALLALVLCLAFVMSMSLAGCGDKSETGDSGELDPYKIYNDAAAKMKDKKDMQARVDIDMKIGIRGETVDTKSSMDIEQVTKSEKEVEMACKMNMTSEQEDLDMDMSMWYKDGWMYIEAAGTKTKQKVDVEDAASKMSVNLGTEKMTKDLADKATAVKDGDVTNIEFRIRGEKVQDLMSKMMKSGDSSVTDVFQALGDVKTGDMTLSAVVDEEGYMTDVKMSEDMSISTNGTEGKTDFEMTMSDIKIDQGLVIDFPSFDDYTEASV